MGRGAERIADISACMESEREAFLKREKKKRCESEEIEKRKSNKGGGEEEENKIVGFSS